MNVIKVKDHYGATYYFPYPALEIIKNGIDGHIHASFLFCGDEYITFDDPIYIGECSLNKANIHYVEEAEDEE